MLNFNGVAYKNIQKEPRIPVLHRPKPVGSWLRNRIWSKPKDVDNVAEYGVDMRKWWFTMASNLDALRVAGPNGMLLVLVALAFYRRACINSSFGEQMNYLFLVEEVQSALEKMI